MAKPSLTFGNLKSKAVRGPASDRFLAISKHVGVQNRTCDASYKCQANGVLGSVAPCRSPARSARILVLRRTSEHWWEDEEEFDAITEMIVPKRMHLVSPASPVSASSAARPQQPPSPSPSSSFSTSTSIGGVGWGPASDATLGAMLGAAGGKLASGFSSSKLKSEAEAVWVRLRQDGPPFFRKVRTRAALDVLEDESAAADAVSRAAEELWGELCGQTWRVELDYGLEGSEAEPRDELLLAVSWLAAARLLNHAGIAPAEDAAETAAARRAGAFVVHVSGYDASSSASASLSAAEVERDGEAGGSGAPRSWRDLRPRLQPLPAPTAAAAEAAAAAAV